MRCSKRALSKTLAIRGLLVLCSFAVFFVAPHVTRAAFLPASSLQFATTQQFGTTHLPHARAASGASKHAFAGEVAQPQAISSQLDVLAMRLDSPRIARVGANK